MKSIYKSYGIYEIKCKVNNKRYVGKTVNSFGDRWDVHRTKLRKNYHEIPNLQKDWNIYGEENFEFNILMDLTGKSADEVKIAEEIKIKECKNSGLSYNTVYGDGHLGCHLSENAKKIIGEKNRIHMTGKKISDETKIKMSKAGKKRYEKMTDEEIFDLKLKMKELRRKYPMTDEGKKKLSNIMKGNKRGAKFTVEQVKNMRHMYEVENKTVRQISDELNLNYGTVRGIVKYERWTDI